jgi:hypothetical protein
MPLRDNFVSSASSAALACDVSAVILISASLMLDEPLFSAPTVHSHSRTISC